MDEADTSDWPDAPCRRGRKQGKARGLGLGSGVQAGVDKVERWAGGAPGHPMGTSGPVRQLDSDGGLCLLGAGSKYLGTCLLEILCRVASKSMMPCHSTSELDESVN